MVSISELRDDWFVYIVAKIRCDPMVVSHRVLESSPGCLHCLPSASNCLENIARGCSSNNCSCIDVRGGLPCCWCWEDKLECVSGGGVNGTCRVYIAEEVGINRNVMMTWLRVVLTAP